MDGKFLGFSGRALEDDVQPKYLNSPESPIYHKSETLLGIHLARPAIREKDQVILVEGNFDLLRLHQEGIRNTVAPLGTALTERQVRYLKRLTENFVLIFDADAAGQKAAHRALEIFLPLALSPRVVLLPEGEDPDSFVRKKGAEPLREMISVAPSLLDVRIEHILEGGGVQKGGDLQTQAKAVRQIGELLRKLPGEIEKNMYLQEVAQRFGLPIDALRHEIESGFVRKSNFFHEAGDDGVRKFPPIERTVLEVLLSGHVNPPILLEEIESKDFSQPALGEIWDLVKEGFRRDGQIDLARLVGGVENDSLKRLLTELAFAGSRWSGEGGKVAADCVRQLRAVRFRGRLKDLSKEIRMAEREHDAVRIRDLMDRKNRLIKEMTSLH